MSSPFARKLNFGKKVLLAAAAVVAIAVPIAVGLINAPRGSAQTPPGAAVSSAPARAHGPEEAGQAVQPAAPSRAAADQRLAQNPDTPAPKSAQTADTHPAFEVASVKPEPPHADWSGNYGCFATDPGRYRCSRATVGMMALQAYGIKMYQFPTYSAYATTEYAVDARVPEGATAEQVRLMLRSLLAERFKLAAHFEKKEMPIYQLAVVQDGARIKESAPFDPDAPRPPNVPDSQLKKDGDGFPMITPQPGSTRALRANGLIRLVSSGTSLNILVNYLNNELDRPVIDTTGLTAKYDFTVTFASDSVKEGSASLTTAAPGEAPEPVGGGRTIFAALERDLGLKLEKTKSMIDVLVIDHVEKTPTPN